MPEARHAKKGAPPFRLQPSSLSGDLKGGTEGLQGRGGRMPRGPGPHGRDTATEKWPKGYWVEKDGW